MAQWRHKKDSPQISLDALERSVRGSEERLGGVYNFLIAFWDKDRAALSDIEPAGRKGILSFKSNGHLDRFVHTLPPPMRKARDFCFEAWLECFVTD